MKKDQEEINIADNPLYHDTWKLLKKYRDVVKTGDYRNKKDVCRRSEFLPFRGTVSRIKSLNVVIPLIDVYMKYDIGKGKLFKCSKKNSRYVIYGSLDICYNCGYKTAL